MPYTLKDKTCLAKLTELHPDLPKLLHDAKPTTDLYGVSIDAGAGVVLHFGPGEIEFFEEPKMTTIKIKKLCPEARMPTKGTEDAACFDLYASKTIILESRRGRRKVPTGLAMEIPSGYCGRIYSRSSSFLKGLDVGSLVVDADYVGEIFIMVGYDEANADFEAGQDGAYVVHEGDRIAQIKFEKLEPTAFEVVETLKETARGTGGYGSTGR